MYMYIRTLVYVYMGLSTNLFYISDEFHAISPEWNSQESDESERQEGSLYKQLPTFHF